MRAARGLGSPGALVGQERQRHENRDPAQQVHAALGQPVGSDGEDEAADRRRAGRQRQHPQPAVGEQPCGDDRRKQEQVPRDHGAEGSVERPEREPERPAREHDLRLDERLEAVRVEPGRGATLELVADEPEAVGRLKVVSAAASRARRRRPR